MTPLVIGFKNYRVSTFQKILSWVIKKKVEAFIASNYMTSELHLKVLKKSDFKREMRGVSKCN